MENTRSLARSLRAYGGAILMVGISTVLGLVIAPQWGTSAVDLMFLPAVLGAAVFSGFGPAILAAIASALAYNYFFTAPFHTFLIHHPADIVTVVVLFLVALVTSHLAASIRAQAEIAEANASRNATIAGFARRLLGARTPEDVAQIAVTEISGLFHCNGILLVQGDNGLTQSVAYPSTLALTPSDLAVASMVFATGQASGRGIAPAMAVEWQFFPVASDSRTLAIIGLARDDGQPAASADRRSLLESLLDQVSLALVRAQLEQQSQGFSMLRERDRVRTLLLSSIGQELSPAIDSLSLAANQLRRSGQGDKELLRSIASDAARLQQYLANVQDLTPAEEQAPVEKDGVSIDLYNRAVTRDGEAVHLSPKEYAVLAELARHPGRVLGHAQLLRSAWGPAQEKQTEYLRVAVRGLRQKLEVDPAHPRLIINEPAVGYRLSL